MEALRQIEELLPALSREEKAELLRMVVAALDGEIPGIEASPAACGGEACVARARIPVWVLEQARRLGAKDEDLLRAYPSLRPADLASAWAYVRTYGEEIDAMIRCHELV